MIVRIDVPDIEGDAQAVAVKRPETVGVAHALEDLVERGEAVPDGQTLAVPHVEEVADVKALPVIDALILGQGDGDKVLLGDDEEQGDPVALKVEQDDAERDTVTEPVAQGDGEPERETVAEEVMLTVGLWEVDRVAVCDAEEQDDTVPLGHAVADAHCVPLTVPVLQPDEEPD